MNETAKRRNHAGWIALLLGISALAMNFVFFANPPLQGTLPWLGLLFGIAALIALLLAFWRAFAQSQIYRGKWLNAVLAVVTLLFVGANLFVSYHARELPSSTAAPQVGQKVPEFTLVDSSGASVSLDSLLASFGDSAPAQPKAVLLIFYRGYW